MNPDNILLMAGAVLLVVSGLAPRVRSIRLLCLLAGIAFVIHFARNPGGGYWLAFAILFVLANAVQLAMLEYRARSGRMLDDERELFEHVMRIEEPSKQRRLLDVIEWQDVSSGVELMKQGQNQPPLIYVAQGLAVIEVDGKQVGTCGPGDFLGEMSLISGQTASATVRAGEAMRIAHFDRDALAALARGVPEIGKALDGALNRSLAAKVIRMNQAARGD
jgi:CRP-like cAMP-binding protein